MRRIPMYKIVSRLLIYGDMPKDTILMELADIVRKMDDKSQTKEELSTHRSGSHS